MIEENKSVMGFNLIWLYEQADLMQHLLTEIDHLALPAPYIGHYYEFTELPAALKAFQSGNTTGKVVLQL